MFRNQVCRWLNPALSTDQSSSENGGRLKKKLSLVAISALGTLVSGSAAFCVYVFLADRIHPDLSEYVATPEGGSATGAAATFTRNARGVMGLQVSRFIRWRLESNYLRTVLNEDEIIKRFLDPATPVATKRLDAWRLAVFNTRKSYEALLRGMNSADPELRAAVAMALGHSNFPDARDLIMALLQDSDERVVRGAIKGLALFEDDEAVAVIAGLLNDPTKSERIRIEAALVLGDIESETALAALSRAYGVDGGEDLRDAIVTGLGKFPFERTENFFRGVIASENEGLEVKVTAVEALANSSRAAIPFLLETAKGASAPEIREAAAWTIGMNDHTGAYGVEISGMLGEEPEPDVRRRLYESMLTQREIPVDDFIQVAFSETNPAAKVAAAHAVARSFRRNPDNTAAIATFEEKAVPALRDRALGDGSLNLKLRSIFGLRTARTPAAKRALESIAQSAKDQRVAGAAKRALNAIENADDESS